MVSRTINLGASLGTCITAYLMAILFRVGASPDDMMAIAVDALFPGFALIFAIYGIFSEAKMLTTKGSIFLSGYTFGFFFIEFPDGIIYAIVSSIVITAFEFLFGIIEAEAS